MQLSAKRSTALACCETETIAFARIKRSQDDHEIVEVIVETLPRIHTNLCCAQDVFEGVNQQEFLVRRKLATKAFGKDMKAGMLVLT